LYKLTTKKNTKVIKKIRTTLVRTNEFASQLYRGQKIEKKKIENFINLSVLSLLKKDRNGLEDNSYQLKIYTRIV